ncbi:MAG: rubrerythrin family protein [Rickettsiales bacterium]|nr:rubrerythrin family protein [Rickettsiales bacterium]
MKLDNTKTKENILKAFAGESQARNRYTYFASVAKKENYPVISAIFEETANHEKEHAKRLFKLLEGGDELEITASFPAGKIGTTLENLVASANGEHEENSEMYPNFAKVAREEGFEMIAQVFENIAKAEIYHEERFKKLIEDLEKDGLFKKEGLTVWKCTNCGFHITAKDAPLVCPACNHKREYFVALDEKLY